MSRSKHSEAQIIAAVKQMEAVRKAEDVAREVEVSTHTIYAWKSKYGGMDVSKAQEAKRLRDENARLRKLVADLSLDKDALQYVIKNAGAHSDEGFCRADSSQVCLHRTRACRLLLVPVSSYRYQPWQNDDGLCEHLIALARKKPRYGYRRLHVLLERLHGSQPGVGVDFVHDVTASGRSIRVLNVIDAYTRENLAMEVDTSFARLCLSRLYVHVVTIIYPHEHW
jgi:putative transposase